MDAPSEPRFTSPSPDVAVEPFGGIVETHTGLVIFAGDRVYKLKKPLRFPFVDHGDVDARRRSCEREVELNRRLAPDVYLGVGGLQEPDRPSSEPIVVMRRLPASRRLSLLVERGVDVDDALRQIAHQVATLHASAPTTGLAGEVAAVAAQQQRWDDNHAELATLIQRADIRVRSDTVHTAATAYLRGRQPLFDQRIAAGWRVDGHGDLLADDIFCLDDGPRILDCLEFDDRLRVGDVLADVAFLAMDLDRLGQPELAWSLLTRHRELLNDRWPSSLAHHYIAYRAQVRAKVACVRSRQGVPGAEDEAARLLALAARHLAAGRVRLVVVGGLPGTGKSTLAAMLGGELEAVVLRSDDVRKAVVGLPAGAHAAAAPDAGIYTSAVTRATYAEMLAEAHRLLTLGESVVLDATWSSEDQRAGARELAAAVAAELTMLRCVAPPDLAAARMVARRAVGIDPSDADADIAAVVTARFEIWPDAIDVPTDRDLGAELAAARAALDPST